MKIARDLSCGLVRYLVSIIAAFSVLVFSSANVFAEDEEFVPAYQNIEEYEEDLESADQFFVTHQGRNYYTSGKEDGFRVFENNEESTDETVGILTFLIAPATIIYMNLEGWWD